MRRFYVGLAATLHDPALAIVDEGGEVLFAEAAERWLQRKRAFNAPPDALGYSAEVVRHHCGANAELVLAINWSRPFLDRLRMLTVCDLPVLRRVLGGPVRRLLRRRDVLVWPLGNYGLLARALLNSLNQAGVNLQWTVPTSAVRYYDHHRTHAALSLAAPFDRAACAVVDGFGEWTSVSCFSYDGGRLVSLHRQGPSGSRRRGSLGMFYAAVCAACGFDPLQGEEWKVMGLAPYGTVDDELHALLRPLLRVEGLEIVNGCSPSEHRRRLEQLQALARPHGSPALEAANLARTGQQIFGEVMQDLLVNLHAAAPCDDLVLVGGCALNSSWNGRISSQTPFRRVYVPPAPADDGTALGAALLAWSDDHPGARPGASAASAYLGSDLPAGTLDALARLGRPQGLRHLPGRIEQVVAELIAQGHIVGWMQGRAEFGPRALGHRSILADPRRADMKDRINERVKFREPFRPFAPSILHEHGPAYFEDYQESRYMERALRFRPDVRDTVPAVVHVDGTGRLQSVRREWSPRLHALVTRFHEVTGTPLILNTSFNVMGRPIVHSVEDALGAYFTTGLDAVAIGDWLLEKEPCGS